MKEVPISVGTVAPLTERQIAEIPIEEAKKNLKYRGLFEISRHMSLEMGFGGIGVMGILLGRPEVVAASAAFLLANTAHALYRGGKLWEEGKELQRQSKVLAEREKAEAQLGLKPKIAKLQLPKSGRIFTSR